MKTKISEVDYFDVVGTLYEVKAELGDEIVYRVEAPSVITYTPSDYYSSSEAVMNFIAHLQYQRISNCAKGSCGQ